jgi:type I restriction enzyme M protein
LTKGEPTKEIWYFEHKLPEGVKAYNKTKPMQLSEFDLEKSWWNNRIENMQAWKVPVSEIVKNNYNLDIKNPNSETEIYEDPDQLIESYLSADTAVKELQEKLRSTLNDLIGK